MAADLEGDEFATEAEARAHAAETARDMVRLTRLHSVRNWFDCTFEVTDDDGRLVFEMAGVARYL